MLAQDLTRRSPGIGTSRKRSVAVHSRARGPTKRPLADAPNADRAAVRCEGAATAAARHLGRESDRGTGSRVARPAGSAAGRMRAQGSGSPAHRRRRATRRQRRGPAWAWRENSLGAIFHGSASPHASTLADPEQPFKREPAQMRRAHGGSRAVMWTPDASAVYETSSREPAAATT